MKRPWIGIPSRYDPEKKRYLQARHYLDAVAWAGGIPVVIPVLADGDLVKAYADRLDGILLPGNPTDIDPALYGRDRHEKLGPVFRERDRMDLALIDIAEHRGLPVLGICFGAQSLNVFRGGGLVQDIPSEVPNALAHDRPGEPQESKAHSIRIDAGSRLGGLLGEVEAVVNSYHHQSIADPGRDLRIAATAPDGVVEAVEDTRGRFIFGVQWHPEVAWATDILARKLFSAFVRAAR